MLRKAEWTECTHLQWRASGFMNGDLTRGLPQQHTYDLIFHHALDVDERRTARTWIDDRLAVVQRERRRFVDSAFSNLPPIYAVRFENS